MKKVITQVGKLPSTVDEALASGVRGHRNTRLLVQSLRQVKVITVF
ncbi:DNA repair protein [Salmonella phage 19]|nr:DNA repair protein [Salmonella phage 19]